MSKTDNREKVPFMNYQEEAEFWDTHDLLNLAELGAKPFVSKGNKEVKSEYRGEDKLEQFLNIRFNGKDLEDIRAIANEKGLGPTTLIRMWTKEKLEDEEAHRKGGSILRK